MSGNTNGENKNELKGKCEGTAQSHPSFIRSLLRWEAFG